jgi:hypothetical protein
METTDKVQAIHAWNLCRLRGEFTAALGNVARDLREHGATALPNAVLDFAHVLAWNAARFDDATHPEHLPHRGLTVAAMAEEILQAVRPLCGLVPPPKPSARARVERLEIEIDNLRQVLANRKGEVL